MKLHRVLLFTSIQMDITPVGKDLHVLLTSDNIPHIGSTVYAKVIPESEVAILSEDDLLENDILEDVLLDEDDLSESDNDSKEPVCEFLTIDNHNDPDTLFCRHVAESLAKKTGQNVLCTGGIFVENPTERDVYKLYENVDEMIRDWTVFFTDD